MIDFNPDITIWMNDKKRHHFKYSKENSFLSKLSRQLIKEFN